MDWSSAADVVSALAALASVYYASRTIKDARASSGESSRLAKLSSIRAEYAELVRVPMFERIFQTHREVCSMIDEAGHMIRGAGGLAPGYASEVAEGSVAKIQHSVITLRSDLLSIAEASGERLLWPALARYLDALEEELVKHATSLADLSHETIIEETESIKATAGILLARLRRKIVEYGRDKGRNPPADRMLPAANS